jgi:hypothetical protein
MRFLQENKLVFGCIEDIIASSDNPSRAPLSVVLACVQLHGMPFVCSGMFLMLLLSTLKTFVA